MALIRPNDLPEDTSPAQTDVTILDGATVRKSTIVDVVNAARPFATQTEAEGGTNATKAMSPLTTKQAIDAIGGAQFATTAQGALADSSLQPGDIGGSVQAHDDLLDSVSGLSLLAGDLLYATGSNAVARLGIGGEGDVLAVSGGVPEWSPSVQDAQTVQGVTPGSTGLDLLADETVSDARETLGLEDFATIADATASSFDVAPDYIRVAGYSSAGDGGAALYDNVGLSEPSHAGKFSITLSDGTTVVWYEIAETNIHLAMVNGSLPDAVGVLGANPGVVVVSTDATVSADFTVPENVHLVFTGGALTIADTVTLTIDGTISAGDYQIFVYAGTGTLAGFMRVKDARPEWWGAVGDGTTLDNAAFESMCEVARDILVPSKTYLMDAIALTPASRPHAFQIRSNTIFRFSAGTVLQAEPNSTDGSAVMAAYEKDNFLIFGNGTIRGEKDTHTGSTGEWGFGLDIRGSNNWTVRDIRVTNCWGDGFYVDELNGRSQHWVIDGVLGDFNGRNNLSIVGAEFFRVVNSKFSFADRTPPMYGIDVEPDSGKLVRNGIIANNICNNNRKGLVIEAGSAGVSRVTLNGNNCFQNSTTGIELRSCTYNEVIGNDCTSNGEEGIKIDAAATRNNVVGNIISFNSLSGILITASSAYNNVSQNTVFRSGRHGIEILSDQNTVCANVSIENSQEADTTYDGITVSGSQCMVNDNFVRYGDTANRQSAGLSVQSGATDVWATNNDLMDSGFVIQFSDSGTGTITTAGNRT